MWNTDVGRLRLVRRMGSLIGFESADGGIFFGVYKTRCSYLWKVHHGRPEHVGKMHRVDGPAFYDWCFDYIREEWLQCDELHRVEGPCVGNTTRALQGKVLTYKA